VRQFLQDKLQQPRPEQDHSTRYASTRRALALLESSGLQRVGYGQRIEVAVADMPRSLDFFCN